MADASEEDGREMNDHTIRLRAWIAATVALALTFVAREVYRPRIYGDGFRGNYFLEWVADSSVNLFGTMAAVFLLLGIVCPQGRRGHWPWVAWVTGTLVFAEISTVPMNRTRDPWDIAATVLASVICAIVYARWINRRPPVRQGVETGRELGSTGRTGVE